MNSNYQRHLVNKIRNSSNPKDEFSQIAESFINSTWNRKDLASLRLALGRDFMSDEEFKAMIKWSLIPKTQ